MSDTFKYLSKTGTEDEPAQEFLKKYTDRYTPEQLARLEANGGASTANQTKYNSVVTNQDAIDDFSSAGGRRGIAKGGDLDHYGNMYESGQWGAGESSIDDLAKKYNLDRSQANSSDNRDVDAGHIWGKDASGKDVYIGKASMDLGGNQSLIASHATQLYGDEVNHNTTGESLDTFGDIQGALLAEWDGGDAKAPTAVKEDVPIEYSPEIQQAQERVATYQNDIMSGKTTDDIFSNAASKEAPSFDATKGAAGIGTPKSGDSSQKATEATDSFLQSKKFDIKQKYNFQAQT